jgi:hypothetical protein
MGNRTKAGRPTTAPPTLQALYRQVTGDTNAHQRQIHARFLKQGARRRRIVNARLKHQTLRAIASQEGISHGSVASLLRKAMESIRKSIAGAGPAAADAPARRA